MDAYEAFQRSNNLSTIVAHYASKTDDGAGGTAKGDAPLKRGHSVGVDVLTPIKPMLAEAISSFSVRCCLMSVAGKWLMCLLWRFHAGRDEEVSQRHVH